MQVNGTDAAELRESKAWIELHGAFEDAVRLITPKELCFRLNITAQYLSAALNYKQSKGIRLEWLPIVLEMAPRDAALAILRALANVANCDVERRKILTPDEKLRAEREVLRRVAPGVLQLVLDEIGE